ncbi:MAG: M20 family metallopeptidase [Desulforhopalus sp.]
MNIANTVLQQKSSLLEHQIFFNDHPELGYHEFKTSEYIISKLEKLGVEYEKGLAGTGILVSIRGENPSGKCILFRTEMDAVSAVDNSGNPLTAHLCGHDAHMAIMLSLVHILSHNTSRLQGTVKVLFQPAEEALGGATAMINSGVLDNPKVNKIFGIHMWSEFETGKVCVSEGPLFAGGDQFSVMFCGTPGHAAMPQSAVDVILAGSTFVQNIQSIVSRSLSPLEPGVVSVCQFSGGTAPNTIPKVVKIAGTARSFSEKTSALFAHKVKHLASTTAELFGATATVQYRQLVPPLINTKKETEITRNAVTSVIPVKDLICEYQSTCVDDFSFYLNQIPGTYFLIGCKGEKYYPVHNNEFYVTEESMLVGLAVLYRLAKSELFI